MVFTDFQLMVFTDISFEEAHALLGPAVQSTRGFVKIVLIRSTDKGINSLPDSVPKRSTKGLPYQNEAARQIPYQSEALEAFRTKTKQLAGFRTKTKHLRHSVPKRSTFCLPYQSELFRTIVSKMTFFRTIVNITQKRIKSSSAE